MDIRESKSIVLKIGFLHLISSLGFGIIMYDLEIINQGATLKTNMMEPASVIYILRAMTHSQTPL